MTDIILSTRSFLAIDLQRPLSNASSEIISAAYLFGINNRDTFHLAWAAGSLRKKQHDGSQLRQISDNLAYNEKIWQSIPCIVWRTVYFGHHGTEGLSI